MAGGVGEEVGVVAAVEDTGVVAPSMLELREGIQGALGVVGRSQAILKTLAEEPAAVLSSSPTPEGVSSPVLDGQDIVPARPATLSLDTVESPEEKLAMLREYFDLLKERTKQKARDAVDMGRDVESHLGDVDLNLAREEAGKGEFINHGTMSRRMDDAQEAADGFTRSTETIARAHEGIGIASSMVDDLIAQPIDATGKAPAITAKVIAHLAIVAETISARLDAPDQLPPVAAPEIMDELTEARRQQGKLTITPMTEERKGLDSQKQRLQGRLDAAEEARTREKPELERKIQEQQQKIEQQEREKTQAEVKHDSIKPSRWDWVRKLVHIETNAAKKEKAGQEVTRITGELAGTTEEQDKTKGKVIALDGNVEKLTAEMGVVDGQIAALDRRIEGLSTPKLESAVSVPDVGSAVRATLERVASSPQLVAGKVEATAQDQGHAAQVAEFKRAAYDAFCQRAVVAHAVANGSVDRPTTAVDSIIETAASAGAAIPGGERAASLVAAAVTKAYDVHETGKYTTLASAVPVSEIHKTAEEFANKLAYRYQHQVAMVDPQDFGILAQVATNKVFEAGAKLNRSDDRSIADQMLEAVGEPSTGAGRHITRPQLPSVHAVVGTAAVKLVEKANERLHGHFEDLPEGVGIPTSTSTEGLGFNHRIRAKDPDGPKKMTTDGLFERCGRRTEEGQCFERTDGNGRSEKYGFCYDTTERMTEEARAGHYSKMTVSIKEPDHSLSLSSVQAVRLDADHGTVDVDKTLQAIKTYKPAGATKGIGERRVWQLTDQAYFFEPSRMEKELKAIVTNRLAEEGFTPRGDKNAWKVYTTPEDVGTMLDMSGRQAAMTGKGVTGGTEELKACVSSRESRTAARAAAVAQEATRDPNIMDAGELNKTMEHIKTFALAQGGSHGAYTRKQMGKDLTVEINKRLGAAGEPLLDPSNKEAWRNNTTPADLESMLSQPKRFMASMATSEILVAVGVKEPAVVTGEAGQGVGSGSVQPTISPLAEKPRALAPHELEGALIELKNIGQEAGGRGLLSKPFTRKNMEKDLKEAVTERLTAEHIVLPSRDPQAWREHVTADDVHKMVFENPKRLGYLESTPAAHTTAEAVIDGLREPSQPPVREAVQSVTPPPRAEEGVSTPVPASSMPTRTEPVVAARPACLSSNEVDNALIALKRVGAVEEKKPEHAGITNKITRTKMHSAFGTTGMEKDLHGIVAARLTEEGVTLPDGKRNPDAWKNYVTPQDLTDMVNLPKRGGHLQADTLAQAEGVIAGAEASAAVRTAPKAVPTPSSEAVLEVATPPVARETVAVVVPAAVEVDRRRLENQPFRRSVEIMGPEAAVIARSVVGETRDAGVTGVGSTDRAVPSQSSPVSAEVAAKKQQQQATPS